MLRRIIYHDLPRPLHLAFIPRAHAAPAPLSLYTGGCFLVIAVFLYAIEQNLYLLADDAAAESRPAQFGVIALSALASLFVLLFWATTIAPDAVTVLRRLRSPYPAADDESAAAFFLAEYHRRRAKPPRPGERYRLVRKVMHAFDLTEHAASNLVAASIHAYRGPAPTPGHEGPRGG